MKMRIACLSLSILAALVFLAVPAPAQDTKDTVPAAVAAPVSEQVNNVMASEELSVSQSASQLVFQSESLLV